MIIRKLKKRTLCKCGCGSFVKPGKGYVRGHNARVDNPSKNPDVVRKIKEALSGEKSPMWGKHQSIETRIKRSKSIKKRERENPEKAFAYHSRIGKLGGKIGGKIAGRANLKNAWKNDRGKMLAGSSKGGKKGGRIGGKNAWKNNRETMLRSSSKGGKSLGGKNLKNAWENDREKMIEQCRKNGKILGPIGGKVLKNLWINNREEMLKMCSENGKKVITKQRNLYPSPIELIVRDYLDGCNIRHKNNIWFKYNGFNREADIVLPKYKLIVECDGFWHSKPETKVKDEEKDRIFNKLGYKVLRLEGSEIRNGSFVNKFLKMIEQTNPRVLLRR